MSGSISSTSTNSGFGLLRFRRSLQKISSCSDIHPKPHKHNSSSNVLKKIRSGLLRRSLSKSDIPSQSQSSIQSQPQSPMQTDNRNYVFGEDELRRHPEFTPLSPVSSPLGTQTPPLEFDDLFLLPNFEDARFRNFAGTNGEEYISDIDQDDDTSSIQSSIDSIHSLYGHIQYIYTDDLYDKKSMANFDKEEERRQLREQMLRELEA
ncbi:uncharacterized protein KQ657_003635 [Scheffersomyces spartinae]|uniref:Uncharacterized protein n=1 Tax=Scheffersomyces spartinae TaxID=45513 RepID=A0A9P7VD39_9ASCO|nr:uncharacterized protein KQ657_003635 [Scheffersomyces spartinae]KAG7195114.1 hypothetical protein KQ657_003635 [Scheffersomyces spartinae]